MSLQRRPPGRPRFVAGLGAVIALVGCVLPWWHLGGEIGELTPMSGNAFESSGILVFVAALATIALLTLPYASERPVRSDRWSSYAIAAAVAWVAFAYRVVELVFAGAFSLERPLELVTQSPGLWITLVGLLVLARAVYDIQQADRRR